MSATSQTSRSIVESDGAMHYLGSSMRGAFRRGDRIFTDPTPFGMVRRGDVIVFASSTGKNCRIIHRVVSIQTDGTLLTQGDNCLAPDLPLVTEQAYVGKATSLERGNQVKRITGGSLGLVQARARRQLRRLRMLLHPLTRPAYVCLGRTIIRLTGWKPCTHRIRLAGPNGTILKYIHRHRTVAQWNVTTGEWNCRKPYDLVIPKPGA